MDDVWGIVIGVLVIIAVAGLLLYRRLQSDGEDTPKKAKRTPYISEAGQRVRGADGTPGVLICPYCGSTQFKAKRSAAGKTTGCGLGCIFAPITILLAPLFALLAPKSRVRCVACGREFRRG